MRNISFSLTKQQFNDRSKDVTRRVGWLGLRPGDALMACEKCQGLKPGEKILRMGEICIIANYRERLDRMITEPEYGAAEVIREGFPDLTPAEFVAMFCKANNCKPSRMISRIVFAHAPEN